MRALLPSSLVNPLPRLLALALLAGCAAACSSSDTAGDMGASDLATPDLALPPLATQPPLGARPADPLAGKPVVACPVYLTERCVNGAAERCALYDVPAGKFVSTPDPLLDRALRFDRWYDLYHQPDGQTAERLFNRPIAAGTPETDWGDPAAFFSYDGVGDAAIWTGVALSAYALRYTQTGTAADLQRLVDKTRRLLTLFDVTGVPGYLARHHYLQYAANAPATDQHIVRAGTAEPTDHVFDPKVAPDLPAAYTDGIDSGGMPVKGTPMWHGNPSIDQYSGAEVALPIVYDLVDDAALKERIARHITCYLKRLERIEIRNLQQNTQALAAFQAYFAGGQLKLDPGDIDLSKIDTVVLYALPQLNAKNEATYSRACPDHIATEPARVIDAASPDFILDVLRLVGELDGSSQNKAGAYDHAYAPSVRGGDAIHLMHLAAVAYRFTGDDQYRRFFWDELVGRIRTVEIARTTGALRMPTWCRSFYGDHITFSPLWGLLTSLPPSPLRTDLEGVMKTEIHDKLLGDAANAKFDLMLAGAVPASVSGGARQSAIDEAVGILRTLGGNGGVLADPRRSYPLAVADVVAALPGLGNQVACPTEAERKQCEDGVSLFGLMLPGEKITQACTGAAGECTLGNQCVPGVAKNALPMSLRSYEDFLWQRNPYKLGSGGIGNQQSPGLDFTESYWLARYYGFITEGTGQVLAWQSTGACE